MMAAILWKYPGSGIATNRMGSCCRCGTLHEEVAATTFACLKCGTTTKTPPDPT